MVCRSRFNRRLVGVWSSFFLFSPNHFLSTKMVLQGNKQTKKQNRRSTLHKILGREPTNQTNKTKNKQRRKTYSTQAQFLPGRDRRNMVIDGK